VEEASARLSAVMPDWWNPDNTDLSEEEDALNAALASGDLDAVRAALDRWEDSHHVVFSLPF
jgi:hypothetical protein